MMIRQIVLPAMLAVLCWTGNVLGQSSEADSSTGDVSFSLSDEGDSQWQIPYREKLLMCRTWTPSSFIDWMGQVNCRSRICTFGSRLRRIGVKLQLGLQKSLER